MDARGGGMQCEEGEMARRDGCMRHADRVRGTRHAATRAWGATRGVCRRLLVLCVCVSIGVTLTSYMFGPSQATCIYYTTHGTPILAAAHPCLSPTRPPYCMLLYIEGSGPGPGPDGCPMPMRVSCVNAALRKTRSVNYV